jgi:hypothetical protein
MLATLLVQSSGCRRRREPHATAGRRFAPIKKHLPTVGSMIFMLINNQLVNAVWMFEAP